MKHILITIPCLHWIHKHVAHRLLLLQKDGRYRLNIMMLSNKPYENNLHHIVNDFVTGDYDFWLSIDSDNPPLENPLDLVELDKDIIGLPTPVWHFIDKKGERPIYWNAYDYVPEKDAYSEHLPRSGLQKVDAIGTGCFLVARRVFEDKELQKGAFTRKLYPDGRVCKGNDISFSERARKRGWGIFCHYDYQCDHYCELSLLEVVKAMTNLYEIDNG